MSWRRILLLSLVLVLLLVGATWALLHRTTAATQIVQRELQALLLPTTSLGGTSLDLTRGRLTAERLRIDDPTRPGTALLAIDSAGVDIGPSFTSLLGVHGVVVDGFRLDLGTELPTSTQLLRPQPATSGGALQVPPIELRGGTVRIAVRSGEAPLELREVALHALPVDGRSDALQLRGSAVLVDPAVPLQLVGEVDLASGQVQLALTFGELAIDRALVLRLTSLCGIAAPELELDAQLRKATVLVRVAGGADREPQFEFGAELAHARCAGGNLPRVIGDADLTVHGSSRDGGSATVHLRQQNQNGRLEVTARATDLRTLLQFEVRVSGTDVAIDSASLPALQLFPSGQEILRALQPTAGRADIELFLRNPHTSSGDTQLELSLREVAMSYHGFGSGEDRAGFPLPMERTRGRVRLRDSVILLEDVHASIAERAGGGSVLLQGRVETERPTGEDTTLDIQAESVTFCPDLRAALNELLDDGGALYDKFAPNGGAAVTVQIRPQSTLPGGWSVTVRPQGASMQWAGFPYRLDELQGSVRAEEHDVWFDLAGRHGDGKLTMRGHLPLGDQALDDKGFEAVIELADITVDDDLRRASAVLAPELDRAWLDSAPTGRFGAQVKVWRQRPTDPLSHDARLDLHGLTLRLPTAPWQATGLQGQLLVQGSGNDTRVDFDALRGGLEHSNGTPAQLAMLGHLRLGSEAVTDLAFVVRDLALDDELGRTLQSLQALDQGTWNSLQPSGRIDVVCRYDTAEPPAQRLRLAVHLVDVASHAAILPRPAEHLTGELLIAGGELRFDDVRGRLGTSEVQCTGGRVRSRPAPDLRTEIAFAVTANGVLLDDGIANLFSGPLGQAVRERHLDGRADLDGLRLQFLLPQPGSAPEFETTIGGQLRLYDLDMTLGAGPAAIKVEGISGVVDLADSTVADRSDADPTAKAEAAAGGRLTGALRGMSLRVFGQPFEQLDAEFTADARELVLPQLRGKLHGGVVQHTRVDRPGLRYRLPNREAPEGQLAADLSVEKLDVYAFLERCGWQNPPYSGQASGKLDLQRLAGSDVLDAIGSGSLVIDRADLGAVPLFTAIYAQLPAADRPRFDHLDAEFTFADKSVRFGRLDVRSTLLAAKGKGSLALDGYLDVEMTLDNLLGTSADPLVMPLIDYLAKNIVTFHLHGYLHDLQAEKRWVTESAPRRRPVMPMPPERPKVPPPGF
jgi:hypothetical protein